VPHTVYAIVIHAFVVTEHNDKGKDRLGYSSCNLLGRQKNVVRFSLHSETSIVTAAFPVFRNINYTSTSKVRGIVLTLSNLDLTKHFL
jgi:hypothetical protein